MIKVLKNKNDAIGYIVLTEKENSKFEVINLQGKIMIPEEGQISLKDPEPFEIPEDKLPDNLKNHLALYKSSQEERARFKNFFEETNNSIIYDFIFKGLTHAQLDKKYYHIEPSGSHDGWKCGQFLTGNGITSRAAGPDYLTWPDDRIQHQLSPLLQEVVKAVKLGHKPE